MSAPEENNEELFLSAMEGIFEQEEISEADLYQHQDLIEEIELYIEKFAKDKAARGDLKIILRAIKELRYAFKVYSPYRKALKVSVFGSARTQPEAGTYQQAVAFGKKMSEAGWFVVTGAANGIMEAAHVGSGREKAMGLNIMLPFETNANHIIDGDQKLVSFKYFFTRKLIFVKESNAVVCLAGGFGTLDEGLEVLTLLQTGKRDMVPVVFLDEPGGKFWHDFDAYIKNRLLADGMISPNDLSLYKLTDNVDEAVEEVRNFYKVYHSMRFVHDRLVIRLKENLTDELLAAINQEYKDILSKGEFEILPALPQEKNEPEIADLPRLVFYFDRHALGRLRQLINAINAGKIVDIDRSK